MEKIQIIKWVKPDVDTMEFKLKAKIVLFKTFNDEIKVGEYDISNNNLVTENDEYYLFNDVKELAVIK